MNETLKKILAMIPEDKKSEAKELGETLQGVLETNESAISKLESQKAETIKSRDDIKTKLKDIGKKLGIDLDGEDVDAAIEAIKSKKGIDKSEAVEALTKEKDNLQKEIDELTETIKTNEEAHKKEMSKSMFKKDFAEAAPEFKVVPKLAKFLEQELESMAVFEDGKTIFKNEDGTTLRINNEVADIKAILKSRREAEIESKEALFFDINAQQNGPRSGESGAPSEEDFIPGQSS